MLALAKTASGQNGLEIVARDMPKPGKGEVLLKVVAAGVCGTDINIYKWPPWLAKRVKLPRILGHEMFGEVAALGEGATRLAVGDGVSLESHVFCGHCYQCQIDRAHLCVNKTAPGVDFDGAFADYVVVPERICWQVPNDMDPQLAAILEPFGIAVHTTLEGAGVSGLSVVVNGCGPIGLMNVATARYFGAETVIAIEPNEVRRRAAEAMGADRVIDPSTQNPRDLVLDMTRGRGGDVVMEYSGVLEGLNTCVDVLTPGGDLRLVAVPSGPVTYDFTTWKSKRPVIHNIHGRRIWSTWVKAVPIAHERRIDLGPILSHALPLKDGLAAFDLVLDGHAVKPILLPN